MKRLHLAALLFSLPFVCLAQSPDVPANYRDLYDSLQAKLNEAGRLFGKPDEKFQPTFAVELTAANGNRGTTLLLPRTRNAVKVNLDAFRSLGVNAVVINASFPMFLKEFPHSEEYLDFHKFAVSEARSRGFKVFYKISEAFRDPVHGHLPVDEWYRGLTQERFMREKRAMIEIVLRDLQPDYLTVASEPDTSAMNTKLDFSPDNYIRYVRAFTKDLPRGKTKIGAGAGTWSPLAYFQRLAGEPGVDYLDMHIYPINRDFFTERPMQIAALARKSGKALVIGEAGLYKTRDSELGAGGIGYIAAYARDGFSFWSPLDAAFIRDLAQFSRAQHVEFMSMFWVNLLFGYADYSPDFEGKSSGELQQLAVRAAVPNILAGKPSLSGEAYRAVIGASK